MVSWNPRRERHQIEQCVGPCFGKRKIGSDIFDHDHTCNRIFVWLCESEDKSAMPLGDRVIEKLQSMDTMRKYGSGPEALERYKKESAAAEAERNAKIARDTKEVARLNRLDNKRLFSRAVDLIRRHDVLRPNK
jgi:hypothetical protein